MRRHQLREPRLQLAFTASNALRVRLRERQRSLVRAKHVLAHLLRMLVCALKPARGAPGSACRLHGAVNGAHVGLCHASRAAGELKRKLSPRDLHLRGAWYAEALAELLLRGVFRLHHGHNADLNKCRPCVNA